MEAHYYYDRDKLDIKLKLIKSIKNIFKYPFLKTNEDLLNSGIDVTYSGTTALVVIAFENILYYTNLEDSKAVII